MPTPAQVTARAQPPRQDRHMPATVTAAGNPCTVTLDPGGASTTARVLSGATYTAGNRVLVLLTSYGNYVIGRI